MKGLPRRHDNPNNTQTPVTLLRRVGPARRGGYRPQGPLTRSAPEEPPSSRVAQSSRHARECAPQRPALGAYSLLKTPSLVCALGPPCISPGPISERPGIFLRARNIIKNTTISESPPAISWPIMPTAPMHLFPTGMRGVGGLERDPRARDFVNPRLDHAPKINKTRTPSARIYP